MNYISRLNKLTLTSNVRSVIKLSSSKGHHLFSYDSHKPPIFPPGTLKLDLANHIASSAFGYPKLNFTDEEKEDISNYLNVRPSLAVFPDIKYIHYLEQFMGSLRKYTSHGSRYTSQEKKILLDEEKKILPEEEEKKIFLCSSGSEANEIALKMAMIYHAHKNSIKYTEKDVEKLILHNSGPLSGKSGALSFQGSFHGRFCASLSCSHSKAIHKKYINSFQWPCIPYPTHTREIEVIIFAVQKMLSINSIFAVIIEPIQCEGGDRRAPDVFYQELCRVCEIHDVPLIVDEIQTGIGGTGNFWAHEYWRSLAPDIITFGKKSRQCGVLFPAKYSEFITPNQIFNTWCGNPIDLIVGNKILSKIDNTLLTQVRNNGRMFKYMFDEEMYPSSLEEEEVYPSHKYNFRGRGHILAFDLESTHKRDGVIKKLEENGVLVMPCGEKSIRLRPALDFTEKSFGIFLEKLKLSM